MTDLSPELERVRQKVEAGEPLTEAEFTLLDRAARQQAGPSLRLTVAHALLNAGEERGALGMLEGLARDYPTHVQVRLGHARALIGLERYSEAEGALRTALTLNPGDPEALKAMAVIALRRGERMRAREWVEEVLRRDPFDGEARLLQAELEAGTPPPGTPPAAPLATAMRPEYVEALLEELRRLGITHLRRGKDLLVRLATGGVARVDLGSLYAGYLEEGRTLAAAVAEVGRELAALTLGLPEEKDALLAKVLPVLRGPTFRDSATGSCFREGPAGLLLYYVLDDPELVRYLPRAVVDDGRATLEEIDAAAWKNLGARLCEVRSVAVDRGAVALAQRRTGLWALTGGDGYDGARLLLPEQRARISALLGDVPVRVSLGRRELALLCREDDAQALRWLASLPVAPDGITGALRLGTDGRLSEVGAEPPPSS